ncbi:MAG: O-antigen ligase family protein [Patescibacteria group bacterium]
MSSFFKKNYLTIFLLIVFFELLSFFGFLVPFINTLSFFIISLVILIFSLIRLEYGIYVLLAELFIGSKGHLFYFEIGSIRISIRMVLFTIVMVSWLIEVIKRKYKLNFFRSKFFIFYFLFFIFFLWGVFAGLIYKNQKDLIFFDANAWLYFFLIFPFFDLINERKIIENILKILTATLSWLAIKTFLIFFFFTHQIKAIMPDLYYWIRTRGLGEITAIDSFYRVFFQSQIYSLIGFFIFISFIIFLKNKKNFYFLFIPTIPLLISFSRSYLLSFILTFLIFLIYLKIKEKFSFFKIGEIFLIILSVFGLSFAFIWFSLKIPPKIVIDLSSLIEKRIEFEEPAVSSRIIQLPYLLSAILEKPILGSGFGKTVSYFSRDPRALERHPLGLYTTYAFEWGYLDIWLKIGLVGLFVFLLLIWKIFQFGWKMIEIYKSKNENFQKSLILGMLFGLIALIITHFTSPYLNHPLGIGYLILCTVIFSYKQSSNENINSNRYLEFS